jgi:hypothetical protein
MLAPHHPQPIHHKNIPAPTEPTVIAKGERNQRARSPCTIPKKNHGVAMSDHSRGFQPTEPVPHDGNRVASATPDRSLCMLAPHHPRPIHHKNIPAPTSCPLVRRSPPCRDYESCLALFPFMSFCISLVDMPRPRTTNITRHVCRFFGDLLKISKYSNHSLANR